MSFSSFAPNTEHKYRENTTKLVDYHVSARQTCPGCRVSRSVAQFVEGKKLCAKCRRQAFTCDGYDQIEREQNRLDFA